MIDEPGKLLQVGCEGTLSCTVDASMTADRFGNGGVRVLSTPYLVGLLESASVAALGPHLENGYATVGTRIDVAHLAATPPGMTVTAHARLVAIVGRKLTLEVEARDEMERIATGSHDRYIVNLQRFLSRVANKNPAPK